MITRHLKIISCVLKGARFNDDNENTVRIFATGLRSEQIHKDHQTAPLNVAISVLQNSVLSTVLIPPCEYSICNLIMETCRSLLGLQNLDLI